jgi:TolA-binding protein
MRCHQTERVLMEDAQNIAPNEHAKLCETCAEALLAVRTARLVLQNHEIVVPPGSKRRAWQAMEKKQRRKEIVLPIFAFSASFAAVALFYLVAPSALHQETHAVEQSNPQLEQTRLVEKKPAVVQRERMLELTEPRLEESVIEVGVEQNTSRKAVERNAKLKRIAAKAKPVHKTSGPDLVATLEAAKDALPSNAPRAAELAERVLGAAEKTTILEAEALAVLADAERRQQRHPEAAALYLRVADHPAGGPFAEEALLQRALILAQLENTIEAIALLELAEKRFASGPTAPERAALLAQMLLQSGDPQAAADAIERASNVGRSMKLLTRRLEVARALSAIQPSRAHALLEPLLDARTPASLRAEAELLLKQ